MKITNDMFDDFMENRFEEILQLRRIKAVEYTQLAFDENFEKASHFLNMKKEQVALAYATKQITSIYDTILNERNYDKLREKINDVIVYLLLIEAMIIGGKADVSK